MTATKRGKWWLWSQVDSPVAEGNRKEGGGGGRRRKKNERPTQNLMYGFTDLTLEWWHIKGCSDQNSLISVIKSGKRNNPCVFTRRSGLEWEVRLIKVIEFVWDCLWWYVNVTTHRSGLCLSTCPEFRGKGRVRFVISIFFTRLPHRHGPLTRTITPVSSWFKSVEKNHISNMNVLCTFEETELHMWESLKYSWTNKFGPVILEAGRKFSFEIKKKA